MNGLVGSEFELLVACNHEHPHNFLSIYMQMVANNLNNCSSQQLDNYCYICMYNTCISNEL